MSGWWRRNRIALAALAVLLPITAATLVGVAWARYYAYEPTIPRDPGTDGTVELADADWGPVRAKDLTGGEGLIAPADSRVIGVAVPVDPHGEPPRCSSPTLVEQSTGRRWEHMTYDLGFEYSSDEHTFCASPEEDEDGEPLPLGPYEIVVGYIVPEDAEGPFWVEISEISSFPSFVRFSVEP